MSDSQLAQDIGEIKGLLRGVHDLVSANNAAVNRRMDDLHLAVTRNLDRHFDEIGNVRSIATAAQTRAETAVVATENLKSEARRESRKMGGAAGGVIGLGIELLKYALGG